MSKRSFLASIYHLVEHVGGMELSDTSKQLIAGYLADAAGASPADRARSTILRYLQASIPTLEEVRERSSSGELSPLDHLVLKMEYEASRLP